MGISHETTSKKSKAGKTVLATAGEIFADGSVLELVAAGPENANALQLLFRNGRKTKIASEIEHGGYLYRPLQIHDSMLKAVRFPSSAARYGSTAALLCETAGLFEKYIGLPTPECMLLAGWNATTWLADRTPSPQPLLIVGPDMDHAMRVFRVLRCACRRPLPLADVSRSTLRDLPMNLRPTLLVNQPDLPAKVRASWRTSNYDDVYIPGHYGSVSHVACAKALYLGFESPSDSWCDSAFHITISAPQKELPSMDALQLAEITKHFQSRYLMWRLDKVVGITDSWRGPGQLNLPACLAEEPGFTTVIAPLVERQKQEALVRKQCDINCVIIEVIWGPSHEEREISVEDITQETNTLLRDRGEFLKYSNEEVGWRLKSCGVSRERVDSGMIVRFSREQRWRVHQAASMCGLSLPIVEGCPDCGSREERPVVEP